MTAIGELVENIKRRLSSLYEPNEARAVTHEIVRRYVGLKPSEIYIRRDDSVCDVAEKNINKSVEELLTGRPLQYVSGETEFCGRRFVVDESVLIPRPETEELAAKIVAENKNNPAVILDVGTGSGCISVSLAAGLPDARVYAVDISEPALSTARKNALINNVNVEFARYDILSNGEFPFDVRFDVIVSNPPYVRRSEKKSMRDNVLLFEPHIALFVDDDNPLIFYEAVADFARKYLNTEGVLWFEINESSGFETRKALSEKGFVSELYRDLFGKDRFIKAVVANESR